MRVSKSNWLRKPRYAAGCRGHTEGAGPIIPEGWDEDQQSLGAQAGWAGRPAVLSSAMDPEGRRKITQIAECPVWVLGEEVKDGQYPRDQTQVKCREGSVLQPHSLQQDCCLPPGTPNLELSDGNSE